MTLKLTLKRGVLLLAIVEFALTSNAFAHGFPIQAMIIFFPPLAAFFVLCTFILNSLFFYLIWFYKPSDLTKRKFFFIQFYLACASVYGTCLIEVFLPYSVRYNFSHSIFNLTEDGSVLSSLNWLKYFTSVHTLVNIIYFLINKIAYFWRFSIRFRYFLVRFLIGAVIIFVSLSTYVYFLERQPIKWAKIDPTYVDITRSTGGSIIYTDPKSGIIEKKTYHGSFLERVFRTVFPDKNSPESIIEENMKKNLDFARSSYYFTAETALPHDECLSLINKTQYVFNPYPKDLQGTIILSCINPKQDVSQLFLNALLHFNYKNLNQNKKLLYKSHNPIPDCDEVVSELNKLKLKSNTKTALQLRFSCTQTNLTQSEIIVELK